MSVFHTAYWLQCFYCQGAIWDIWFAKMLSTQFCFN